MHNEILETPNPKLIQGMEEFNCQQFFHCHEIWEQLWLSQVPPEKTFTQGLIQIAVACHHLHNGNSKGACRLFIKGLAKLADFSPVHAHIDVADLIMQVEQMNVQLTSKPLMIGQTSKLVLPQIKMIKQG